MPTLSILRHAQSTFNASLGQVDEYDANLTPLGESQAASVTGDFDLVVVSPMRRARRTLELSQITYRNKITVEESREMMDHKTDIRACEAHLADTLIPESEEEIMERITQLRVCLRELLKGGKKVLLVAHYFTLVYLTSNMVLENGKLTGELDTGMGLGNAQLVEVIL